MGFEIEEEIYRNYKEAIVECQIATFLHDTTRSFSELLKPNYFNTLASNRMNN